MNYSLRLQVNLSVDLHDCLVDFVFGAFMTVLQKHHNFLKICNDVKPNDTFTKPLFSKIQVSFQDILVPYPLFFYLNFYKLHMRIGSHSRFTDTSLLYWSLKAVGGSK